MKGDTPSVSESIASREKREATRNFRAGPGKGALFRLRRAWTSAPHARQKLRDEERLPVLLGQLKDYCQNSSLVGFKYITEVHRTCFERIMWIIIHLIMIGAMGTIVWTVLLDYKHTPVITEVESDHYPSKTLDFPAVSVCSINRISRKAAVRLAKLIASSNITNLNSEEILPLLYSLGNLYESSFNIRHENKEMLDALLQKYFRGEDNLTEIMKELTPRCKDIFLKCRFRSKGKNCSELFSFRKTQDGFCCTFNYARESDDLKKPGEENRVRDPYKIEKLGKENGLTFLMEPFLDDYFFSILPINGWKIMIFNPSNYPDNTSGSISNALISPGTENFLELDAVSFFSEKSVRSFDMNERKCVFNDEITALFNGYTFSDCIVDCKLDDVWRSCNCRPFFYPMRFNRRACNTSDVKCLNKFKFKWLSVIPHEIKKGGDESKILNNISNETIALRCKSCYPSCNDVRYYLQSSSVKYTLKDKLCPPYLNHFDNTNQSLVHIFFSKYGTVRLKQDAAYYWYELLSDIGGLCGVFIGFSLISVAELLYYIVLLGGTIWLSHNKPISSDNNAEEKAADVQSIYWSELAPRKLALKHHAKMHDFIR